MAPRLHAPAIRQPHFTWRNPRAPTNEPWGLSDDGAPAPDTRPDLIARLLDAGAHGHIPPVHVRAHVIPSPTGAPRLDGLKTPSKSRAPCCARGPLPGRHPHPQIRSADKVRPIMSCDVDSAGRHSSGEPVSHATPSRAPSSVRDNPEHWRTRHPCRPNSSAGGVGDHLHVISTEHSQVVGDRVALDTKLHVDELTPLPASTASSRHATSPSRSRGPSSRVRSTRPHPAACGLSKHLVPSRSLANSQVGLSPLESDHPFSSRCAGVPIDVNSDDMLPR